MQYSINTFQILKIKLKMVLKDGENELNIYNNHLFDPFFKKSLIEYPYFYICL